MNRIAFSKHGEGGGIDSRYAWARLAVSMVLSTIGGAGMWSVVVVLPAVQAEFGSDRGAASLSYTAAMAGFALGNVVIGRLIDRMGYWIPALAASLAQGAGFLLAALSETMLQFSLVHFLLIGAGSSAIFGPLIADISHWFVRRRGVAVAAAASGSYLAGAFWPIVMAHAMQEGGWRFTYGAIGVACLVTMVPLVLLLRRPAPSAEVAYTERSAEGCSEPSLQAVGWSGRHPHGRCETLGFLLAAEPTAGSVASPPLWCLPRFDPSRETFSAAESAAPPAAPARRT